MTTSSNKKALVVVLAAIVLLGNGCNTPGLQNRTRRSVPAPTTTTHDYGSPFLNALHGKESSYPGITFNDDERATRNAHVVCDDIDRMVQTGSKPDAARYVEEAKLAPQVKMWPMTDEMARDAADEFVDLATEYYCPQYK